MGNFKYRIGIIFFIILTAAVVYFYSPEESLEEIKDYESFSDLNEKLESPDIKKGILPEKKIEEKEYPLLDIPFIPQAPLGEWDNPIYQDGCEEAASLMAIYWARGLDLNNQIAKEGIAAISQYQEDNFGGFIDTSVFDTMERIIKGYFGYSRVRVEKNIVLSDIIQEIEKGNAVIVPTNGRLLNNPYYTPPGPERHNLIIRGYDSNTKEFIVNDNGTKRGELYRYDQDVMYNAIRDYPTGDHLPITKIEKNMIVVWK